MSKRKLKAVTDQSGPSGGITPTVTTNQFAFRTNYFSRITPRQAYELSIPIRRCVDHQATQIVKATRKLVTKDAQEIVSGDAYDFMCSQITDSVINELCHWWDIEGEMAIWFNDSISPTEIKVLDPSLLIPIPADARNLQQVRSWIYTDPLFFDINNRGAISVEVATSNIAFTSNFNPNVGRRLRGLSRWITGAMAATTNYYIQKTNANFFHNNARPEIIIRVPKGTREDQCKKIVNEFITNHNILSENSSKVAAVAADDMDINVVNQTIKDGNFMNLSDSNDTALYALGGLPPVISQYGTATYDSASEQYRSYFELEILPKLEFISNFIQVSIFDRFFTAKVSNKRDLKAKIQLQKQVARSSQTNGTSSLLFILDPDSMPIMADLRSAQLQAMDDYRRKTGSSFKVAADYAGIDRPSNEADDIIFVASDQTLVQSEKTPEIPIKEPIEPVEPEEVADKKDTKELESSLRDYRATLVKAVDEKTIYSLKSVINLFKEPSEALFQQLHLDYLTVKELIKDNADTRAVKDYLNNGYKKSKLKGYL